MRCLKFSPWGQNELSLMFYSGDDSIKGNSLHIHVKDFDGNYVSVGEDLMNIAWLDRGVWEYGPIALPSIGTNSGFIIFVNYVDECGTKLWEGKTESDTGLLMDTAKSEVNGNTLGTLWCIRKPGYIKGIDWSIVLSPDLEIHYFPIPKGEQSWNPPKVVTLKCHDS